MGGRGPHDNLPSVCCFSSGFILREPRLAGTECRVQGHRPWSLSRNTGLGFSLASRTILGRVPNDAAPCLSFLNCFVIRWENEIVSVMGVAPCPARREHYTLTRAAAVPWCPPLSACRRSDVRVAIPARTVCPAHPPPRGHAACARVSRCTQMPRTVAAAGRPRRRAGALPYTREFPERPRLPVFVFVFVCRTVFCAQRLLP